MLHPPTTDNQQGGEKPGAAVKQRVAPSQQLAHDSTARPAASRLAGGPGNQAILRMLSAAAPPGRLQTKLNVNRPGDSFEREADRVADTVMRMPDSSFASPTVSESGPAPSLRRKCACGGGCSKCRADRERTRQSATNEAPAISHEAGAAPVVRRKCSCGGSGECSKCKEEHAGALQRAAVRPASARVDAPPIVGRTLRSPGHPMDAAARAFFEPRFGVDFGHVRIHTGRQAAESARAVAARAYTVKSDIVFGAHEYAPHTPDGGLLLAHELAHVLQQARGAQVVQRQADAAPPQSQPESQTPPAPDGGAAGAGAGAAAAAAPAATPTGPAGPLCPAVPTTTPGTCPARHSGYCSAVSCFPSDGWLGCACTVSNGICDAADAFHFLGIRGFGLLQCLIAQGLLPGTIATLIPSLAVIFPNIFAKGDWFLRTNQCIWGHWRAALDAINNPSIPVPSGLTPGWAAAVTTCRAKGVGSSDCCVAHVVAEQQAIDICGPYDSTRFGALPTDVPGAPLCSLAAGLIAPGPPFTGDFGSVADRIKYGNALCCHV